MAGCASRGSRYPRQGQAGAGPALVFLHGPLGLAWDSFLDDLGNGIRTSGPPSRLRSPMRAQARLGPIKFRGYSLPRDPDRFTLRQADRAGEAYAQVMEKLESR